MSTWPEQLRVDPFPRFLASGNEALVYFVERDLLDEPGGAVDRLWALPGAQRLIRKQQEDGSWRYPGQNRKVYPETNYDLLETFRVAGQLVEQYGFNRQHPAIQKAAEYLFSCQTEEGDIRGILGTQYMPYYHAAIMELLIKAGCGEDLRVEKGLEWLLAMRQDDGGWIVPAQAVPAKDKTRELWSAPPLPPDRTRPFSHLATGMVLRAFAAHPRYRPLAEVQLAGARLKSRFLQADRYNDRQAPSYWYKLQFPFWWTNLLTALDSLSWLGFSVEDPDVQKGLEWFVSHQEDSGLWKTSYEQVKRGELTAKEREAMLWVGLAICRLFKRFYR
jgi:Squalene-hopene cyclase C-terminal domain